MIISSVIILVKVIATVCVWGGEIMQNFGVCFIFNRKNPQENCFSSFAIKLPVCCAYFLTCSIMVEILLMYLHSR